MARALRYLVIGASGSGKTTLARVIATRLGLPYTPTDPFYWEPGWKAASPTRVGKFLEAALAQPAWVLDGNFDDRREQVWTRADCIVWLDLPWVITVGRVLARNVNWALTGETIWSGNRMTWRRAWSGVRHAARSVRLKRRVYPGYLAALQGPIIVHLTRRGDVAAWVRTLSLAREVGG